MLEKNKFDKIQISNDHYFNLDYISQGRWFNYFLQIKNVLLASKIGDNILEVGKGNGIVSGVLEKMNLKIKTLDIDKNLKPDIVSSILETPCQNGEFDVVLAAEILEHIPFNLFNTALKEISRISKKYAVISIPHMGVVIKINIKIPLIKEISIFFKIPYFWKKHIFNGQHYWESGKKYFPLKKIRKEIDSAGWIIVKEFIDKNDPSHWHCLLEKNH